MVTLTDKGVYLLRGQEIATDTTGLPTPDEARENTITYSILRSHDVEGGKGDKMVDAKGDLVTTDPSSGTWYAN